MANIVSAAAYIFAKNPKREWCILCGKRSGNKPQHYGGLYDVPVGMREPNEDIVDTARREVYEETGINIPKNQFRFIEEQPWGDGVNVGSNFLVILNSCPQIGKGDWEHVGFQWLPVSQVGQYWWAFGMNDVIIKFYKQFVAPKQTTTLNESQIKKVISESLKELLSL
jgi:8-oxo-dGTP pyrophosphatase MutT (NUDIX family)